MSVDHVGGNLLNQLAMEEHDGTLNAHRVVSAATVYAVVNTAAAGEASVVIDGPVAIKGNLTLSDSKSFIGLVSVSGFANPLPVSQSGTWNVGAVTAVTDITNPISVKGNITISDSKGFIGLVTVGNTVSTTFSGNVTLDAGSKTGIVGNVTLSDSKNFIGLTTTTLGSSPAFVGIVTVANTSFAVTQSGTWDEVGINDSGNSITVDGTVSLGAGVANVGFASITPVTAWPDPKTYIGLVTVGHTVTVGAHALTAGAAYVGLATVDIGSGNGVAVKGNVTISDSKTFIGLVTIGGMSTVTLSDPKGFIGLVTIGGMSTVTLTDSKTFIGLVTAWSRNAGTTKTLIPKTITLSSSSVATIAVPTNTFYVTNVLFSSDATVRISIKSDVTYLTGNASIGVVLNPGGGWVERGSADSPSYIGLAAAKSIVVEKFDMTGTKANVGGKIIYYEE